MRAVTRQRNFVEAVRGARREAEAAFGDGSVFLEKLVEDPRHVEVQVIGDQQGNVLHLFERECSIQRRHQKVIEEAPSPALDQDLRNSICSAAVRFASEAGYHNAGTVEFLLDGDQFYFLEMNARLQVEHPVTELVTGFDLLHLQLAVAAGEPLRLTQDDVTLRGSAIEARIYAEDEQGMPSGGLLEAFSPPEGAGVRNDAAFEAGETTIGFLEVNNLTEPQPERAVPREAMILASSAELHRIPSSSDPFAAGPWRLLGATTLESDEHRVEAERAGPGRFRITAEGEESIVEVLYSGDGRIRALIDEEPLEAEILLGPEKVLISLRGETHTLRKLKPPAVDETGPGADAAASLTAPMPGTVVKVLVEEGQDVEEGQLLLILEAMKMEQPVSAPHAGVVHSLPFDEGSLVPGGAVLAEVWET